MLLIVTEKVAKLNQLFNILKFLQFVSVRFR